mmetsp:Transcript_146237/g.407373  ORF Transcript_146237/g.407373 Transcript_146237/m.407373 type:complete len:267 (-) Transcript_146237:104-904(-)
MCDLVVEDQARTLLRSERVYDILWQRLVIVCLRLAVEVCGAALEVVVQVEHERLDTAECIGDVKASVEVRQEEASSAVSADPEARVQALRHPQALQDGRHTPWWLATRWHDDIGQVRPCPCEEQPAEVIAHDRHAVRHADPPAVAAIPEAERLSLRDDVVALRRSQQVAQEEGRIIITAVQEIHALDGSAAGAGPPECALALAQGAHAQSRIPAAPSAADAGFVLARLRIAFQRHEPMRSEVVHGIHIGWRVANFAARCVDVLLLA